MGTLKDPIVPAPRPLPVVLLLDASGSMKDDGKIDQLNKVVKEMLDVFAQEDHWQSEIQVTVVTFSGSKAQVAIQPTRASDIKWEDLQATGKTPLGNAFLKLKEMLEDTSLFPGRVYAPTIILVSDGLPTDEWELPLQQLLASPRASKAQRLAMGIGPEADYEVLKTFVANPDLPVFQADGAREIRRFFRVVTMSVTSRSRSATPDEFPRIDFDEDRLL